MTFWKTQLKLGSHHVLHSRMDRQDPRRTAAPAEQEEMDLEKRPERFFKISDIAARTDVAGVLDRILKTPITLQAGEVLGISRDVAHHMLEAVRLKPQAPKPSNLVATSFATKTRGILIKLQIQCNGNLVEAILDTGSMLNICNSKIWKTTIQYPMDITQELNMNDANGGEGKLKGLVKRVPIGLGNILTFANIYVGEHVSFDLLLG